MTQKRRGSFIPIFLGFMVCLFLMGITVFYAHWPDWTALIVLPIYFGAFLFIYFFV
ncbi:MAG: hypothetical protein Q7R57_09425 [Dehalococcoidales bacterium]|nr:hypothetical protein [Dehalococcoidales bacterium]